MTTLSEMGATLNFERRDPIGEPIADLIAKTSKLCRERPAVDAAADDRRISHLAVIAAFARRPRPRIVGAAELRVKEERPHHADGRRPQSLRRRCGRSSRTVRGARRGPDPCAAAPPSARMAIIASPCRSWCWAWRSKDPVIVDDAEMIATSFPGSCRPCASLGGDIGRGRSTACLRAAREWPWRDRRHVASERKMLRQLTSTASRMPSNSVGRPEATQNRRDRRDEGNLARQSHHPITTPKATKMAPIPQNGLVQGRKDARRDADARSPHRP